MSFANSASTGSGKIRADTWACDVGITFPPASAHSGEAVPAFVPMLLVTLRRWDAHRAGRSRRSGYVRLVLGAVLAAIHVWPDWLKNCDAADEHEHQCRFSFSTA